MGQPQESVKTTTITECRIWREAMPVTFILMTPKYRQAWPSNPATWYQKRSAIANLTFLSVTRKFQQQQILLVAQTHLQCLCALVSNLTSSRFRTSKTTVLHHLQMLYRTPSNQVDKQ